MPPTTPNRFATVLALAIGAGLLLGASSPLPDLQTTPLDGGQIAYVEVDKAAPVVVFENGLGGQLKAWNRVAPAIAETNTIFAYDRPGVGASTPTDRPRDAAGIVEDLRALLKSRHLPPPYILVGHSMGALDMQLYARRYPAEVAGLVLVDSTHPKSFSGPGSMENGRALPGRAGDWSVRVRQGGVRRPGPERIGGVVGAADPRRHAGRRDHRTRPSAYSNRRL